MRPRLKGAPRRAANHRAGQCDAPPGRSQCRLASRVVWLNTDRTFVDHVFALPTRPPVSPWGLGCANERPANGEGGGFRFRQAVEAARQGWSADARTADAGCGFDWRPTRFTRSGRRSPETGDPATSAMTKPDAPTDR